MISGRNPWRYATTKDECFSAYLHDEDFLRSVLPISQNANTILKRIFNLNPLCRISLPELRKEIIRIDTFFMDQEELSVAAATVRKVAKDFSQGASQHAARVAASDTLFEDSDNTDSSTSSDELYVYSSPPDDHTVPPETPQGPSVDSSVSSEAQTSDSTSSLADSEGPITPATRAIDPAIEVPDLPDGESIDQSAGFPASMTTNIKRPHNRTQLLRVAFQRIKALSSGSRSS